MTAKNGDKSKISAFDILKNINQSDLQNVRRIIMHLKKDVTYENIVLYSNKIFLDKTEQLQFYELLQRYKNKEPISKIIGKKYFWNHEFIVNKNVLDPRQDTETIIESVLKYFDKKSELNFLDIGTGSGCILLSLLAEFANAKGIGIDISREAIDVAEKNKEKLGIKNATFFNIGWNEILLHPEIINNIDVIVSNPPYIKTADINTLDENVKNFDPIIALDGGENGLDAYREISFIAKKLFSKKQKKNPSFIFFEVGFDQAKCVIEILISNNFFKCSFEKDLNGINRVVIAQFE